MMVPSPGEISTGPDSPVIFILHANDKRKWLERWTVSGKRVENGETERTHPNGGLMGSDETVKLCIRLIVWAHRNVLYS